MANYIGKEPTPVPLSTADYQDSSVTAAKLAAGAAVGNIGYTPFDEAGGTVSGATTFQGNVTLQGVTDITDADVTTLDVTGVTTLGGDPTLPLQAATKQYVDNNFQLATGSVQTLNTNLTLTAASARVFEFTTAAEFVVVSLPDATTLSISNGKFVFRNEGKHVIGVKDNAGNLIGAVGPNSTANCFLYDTSTAAGKWSMTGDDVRPFFISNSNLLPQSGTTVSDTLLSTAYALTIKLTDTSYVVVHEDNTATNKQVVAYAVDTSTTPATIGNRTVLAALSVTSGVGALAPPCIGFRVTNTTAYVANSSSLTSHVVLTITGTSIAVSNTFAGAFATIPFQHNPILGEITQVQRITDDLYLYAIAPSAAVISYVAAKIDGTTIRLSAAVTSPQTNGTGFVGLIDMRLIDFNAGTGVGTVGVCHTNLAAAPFNLFVNRVVVTRNASGSAPTITSPVSSVQATGAALAATANFGFAVDQADPEFGCVFYYANSTVFPTFNGISNLLSGILTSTAANVVISSAAVATGFQRFGIVSNGGTASTTTAGMIGTARGLLFDQYGPGAWRAYLINALSTRFIKITHTAGVFTSTLADFSIPDGTNTVSGLTLIGGRSSRYADNTGSTTPAFGVLSNSAILPAAGQTGGAKIYLMFDQANKINLIDVYAPATFSIRDSTPTLIGLQIIQSRSGYFLLPVGDPTATTTNQGSFNTWAVFKMSANGAIRYFGQWQLPFKNANEVVFNSQFGIQENEMTICSNGIEFDQVEAIHFRRFAKIELAVT
jgi:hypothetical protein